MLYDFVDFYNLNIKDFHDKLNVYIDERTAFYNNLSAINCTVLGFETIDNEIVYTGETVNIFNGKDLYLTILRRYKSWSLQIYSTVGYTINLINNCTDFANTIHNFLNERRSQIQRIYEDYFIDFSPIENTAVFETETTTYTGTEKNTTSNSGTKTTTNTESGTENNTNIKSGSMTDNLDISGTERDTDVHSVSSDNSNSLLTDSQDVNTKQYDTRRDNRTETYNNVTDSNTKTFDNRKSESVESFNNYKSEDLKEFTNRKNETTHERHGNIGVTTNIKLLNDDINFRLQHNILNDVCNLFIAEYGFLA